MTTRVWTTGVSRSPQAVALSDAMLRQSLATVSVPDLSGFRSTFQALSNIGTQALTQAAERIRADLQRASETLQAMHKRLPRAVRRASKQGKYSRKTRDRCAKAWPGTDAVTPDHPARVVYKHLLTRTPSEDTRAHLVRLDRVLTWCADADDRALHTERITERITEPTADLTEGMAPEAHTVHAHSPEPPRFLVAVTASRNAPADAHARARITNRFRTAGPTEQT